MTFIGFHEFVFAWISRLFMTFLLQNWTTTCRLYVNKPRDQGPGPTLKSHLRVLKEPGTNPKTFLRNDWAQGPGTTLKSHLRVLKEPGMNPKLFLWDDWARDRGPP